MSRGSQPPGPPQPPQVKINLAQAEDIKCDNCGNYTFVPVVLLKRVSALQSPNGQPGMAPIEVMACNACGFVNDEFLPIQMRKPKAPEQAEPQTSPTKTGLTLLP